MTEADADLPQPGQITCLSMVAMQASVLPIPSAYRLGGALPTPLRCLLSFP